MYPHPDAFYTGVYKSNYACIKYSPRVFLGKHFYIGPLINYSFRINYSKGDTRNQMGLEDIGFLDSKYGKNRIKSSNTKLGIDFGAVFFKGRICAGINLCKPLFPSFSLYYKEKINYFLNSQGIYLTYKIFTIKKNK